MSINSHVQDPLTGKKTNVLERDETNRIPVLTERYKTYKNRSIFFTNPDFGVNLNVNGSSGGTVDDEGIHNGTDNTWWTATAISGTWDFASTDYAYAGTYSIDATDTVNNEVAQFENDVDFSLNLFLSLQGWIYIISWPDVGTKQVLVYGWDTTTNSMVGNEVDIGAYVNIGNTGEWQQFNIPLSDMGLLNNTINALRIRTIDEGANQPPDYYLDEMIFTYGGGESVGPQVYTIQPEFGIWYHVLGLGIAIAAPYVSTLTDASMPKIPYNGLLGITLESGLNYQRYEEGQIVFSSVIHHLLEIVNQFDANINSYGSSDDITWVKIDFRFREPYLLKSEDEDSLRIIINDNLSTLNYFRIVSDCRVEQRI